VRGQELRATGLSPAAHRVAEEDKEWAHIQDLGCCTGCTV